MLRRVIVIIGAVIVGYALAPILSVVGMPFLLYGHSYTPLRMALPQVLAGIIMGALLPALLWHSVRRPWDGVIACLWFVVVRFALLAIWAGGLLAGGGHFVVERLGQTAAEYLSMMVTAAGVAWLLGRFACRNAGQSEAAQPTDASPR